MVVVAITYTVHIDTCGFGRFLNTAPNQIQAKLHYSVNWVDSVAALFWARRLSKEIIKTMGGGGKQECKDHKMKAARAVNIDSPGKARQ